MKDEFDIIDLDQTDTIPSGEQLEELIGTGEAGEELDGCEPEPADEGYADEEPDSETEVSAPDGVLEPDEMENEIEGEIENNLEGEIEDNLEDGQEAPDGQGDLDEPDEDYGPDAEPILADVTILPSEETEDEPVDVYSPEVFQGEVSVDTVLLNEIAASVREKESGAAEAEGDSTDFYTEQEDAFSDCDPSETEGEEYFEDVPGEEYDGGILEEESDGSENYGEDVDGSSLEEAEGDLEEDLEEDSEELEEAEEPCYDEDLIFLDGEEEYDPAEAEGLEEDEEDEAPKRAAVHKKSKRKKKGLAGVFLGWIQGFGVMEWVIAGTGVAVLIVAIVVLSVWSSTRRDIAQTANLYAVGSQLSDLGIAGESGLLAVTDVAALKEIPLEEEQLPEDTEDSVSENGIQTRVTFTSVEQDLKIKFVNDETERLITEVAFEVHLKDSKDKETVLTDEDKDGIIYEKPMTSGEYTVEITPVEGYEFLDFDKTVTVKEKITYEQIEIKEEIKTEAEVNAAVEDTAVNAAEQEQAQEEAAVAEEDKLADTVEWVESTKTAIEGSTGGSAEYNQIDKNTINEPSYTSSRALTVANEFYAATLQEAGVQRILTRTNSLSGAQAVIYRTEDADPLTESSAESLPAPVVADDPTAAPTQEATLAPAVETTETPTQAPTKEATQEPTQIPSQTPTATASAEPTSAPVTDPETATSPSAQPSVSPSAAATATPAASNAKIEKVTLTETSLSVLPGYTKTIAANAKMSDKTVITDASAFRYESADTSVATVDSTGVVTGLGEGKTKITVSYEDIYGNSKSATCTVTVSSLTVTEVSFKKTELSIPDGTTQSLSVTAVMSDGSKITDASKFRWESSKEDIATVKAGEVTAKKEGSTVIKATYTDGAGTSKEASCTVTVTKNAQSDTSTKLTDKNGNQVYIKDSSGSYVEAVYSDYYSAGAFYLKAEVKYKYTGWQTLDGNVYFYDKNNNKVTGDQVIQGVKYHFTDDGILAMDKNGKLGIDVSKWNGNIDWNAVKNSGITFVIIRCGYRGSSSGVLVEDPTFKSNIKGATAAGLKVGIYFFTQAVNEVEAVEEASMCLSLIKGYGISYPIFIDTEKANGRADGLDKATRTAVCKAFCETIKSAGYTPGIYASKYWYYDNLNYSSLSGYRIWLAQYSSEPSFSNRYDLWQYSSKGSVSGISGRVDMNWSYLGY